MRTDQVTKTITITGRPKHVQEVLEMLRYMDYLGTIGHSTRFEVEVDGDGSGRIKMGVVDLDPEHERELLFELMKERMDKDHNIKTFWIC